ncbi:hypothetical protein [Streptomyces sp. NPDC088350]|uniref:hypothetical protein n=1 Tax=Streptomyces sp. NPDC088350 TaxID=3365854 RepID=UPI0037F1B64E
MAKKGAKRENGKKSLTELLRVPAAHPVDLSSYDAAGTPGGPADKAAGLKDTARMGEHLADLQERLWAASTAGDRRRLLLDHLTALDPQYPKGDFDGEECRKRLLGSG